jgi:hypothetical protein
LVVAVIPLSPRLFLFQFQFIGILLLLVGAVLYEYSTYEYEQPYNHKKTPPPITLNNVERDRGPQRYASLANTLQRRWCLVLVGGAGGCVLDAPRVASTTSIRRCG